MTSHSAERRLKIGLWILTASSFNCVCAGAADPPGAAPHPSSVSEERDQDVGASLRDGMGDGGGGS